MIRFIRELRLIPIALLASACLLALKTADFMLDDGYLLGGNTAPTESNDTSVIRTTPDVVQQSGSALSWARQMFNFPDGGDSAPTSAVGPLPADSGNADITGSVAADAATKDGSGKGDAAPQTAPATVVKDSKDAKPPPAGKVIELEGPGQISGAERAILERLQERRQELDTRARELDIRESLIKAAEKRMGAQLAELKDVESKIAVETQQKDDAQNARLKGLVTMYENMKARDAAKIFDRLDIGVLLQVSSQINPRQMADILAQMSPDTAERLTVELASKAQQVKQGNQTELPKIEGQPTTQ
jgi:flagellar motility protein MotE (MotC chaperone)